MTLDRWITVLKSKLKSRNSYFIRVLWENSECMAQKGTKEIRCNLNSLDVALRALTCLVKEKCLYFFLLENLLLV